MIMPLLSFVCNVVGVLLELRKLGIDKLFVILALIRLIFFIALNHLFVDLIAGLWNFDIPIVSQISHLGPDEGVEIRKPLITIELGTLKLCLLDQAFLELRKDFILVQALILDLIHAHLQDAVHLCHLPSVVDIGNFKVFVNRQVFAEGYQVFLLKYSINLKSTLYQIEFMTYYVL